MRAVCSDINELMTSLLTLLIFFPVELHISETDREYLEADRDLRQKLKRKMDSSDELTQTKDALVRMDDEIKQLREELAKIKKEQERGAESSGPLVNYALGYDAKAFMAMTPTKSLQWVSDTLVPKLKQEMDNHRREFSGLQMVTGEKTDSIWTCSGFNRGGSCTSRWHVHDRPAKNNPSLRFKDLRLHCCALCYEGLGVLINHPVTSCPWILTSTWSKLGEQGNKK